MPPISRILLATDFSKSAEPATELAIQLARQLSARLTLLYVYFAPLYMGPFGDAYIMQPDLAAKLRADGLRALEQLSQRVSEAGVAVDVVAMEGLVSDVILEVATSRSVDMLVMGTHGRTGFKHLLLGSVAERVVRLAKCPVLTVREPATQS